MYCNGKVRHIKKIIIVVIDVFVNVLVCVSMSVCGWVCWGGGGGGVTDYLTACIHMSH